MIHIGTVENEYADKTRAADGTITVELVPVKVKYIEFVMPWKRTLYSITDDDIKRRHPKFVIYWHKHPRYSHVSFARWSWG